jgi:hypothetical protein
MWNLSLGKFRQKSERFLPAETANFGRNDSRHPFLRDVHLRPDGYLLQGYRHSKFPRQVWIVKLIRATFMPWCAPSTI